MTTAQIVMGIILLVSAVFLVVAVLLQSSKNSRLSGSIAGGAETFFGKSKGKTIDKVLSRLTVVVSIIFVILVIVVFVIQPNTQVDPDKYFDDKVNQTETDSSTLTETESGVESESESVLDSVTDTTDALSESAVEQTDTETETAA